MSEIINTDGEILTGLNNIEKRIFANNLMSIEATYGDHYACRVCNIQTPIGIQGFMPAKTLRRIHDFLAKYDSGRVTTYLDYHERGQLSDYSDPNENWNMADVLCDGLTKTRRFIYVYLHGIDPSDNRALNAVKTIHTFPRNFRDRLFFVVSTDPFGPCNVPEDQAENIGRQKSLTALQTLQGLPNILLLVLYAPKYRDRIKEELIVKRYFNQAVPSNIRYYKVLAPTRSKLPVFSRATRESAFGFKISHNSKVLFRSINRIKLGWDEAGDLNDLFQSVKIKMLKLHY